MGEQRLKNLKSGQKFSGNCVIRKKELKHKKTGDPYLNLELGDSSGRVYGKVWKDAEKIYGIVERGQSVEITGKVRLYKSSKVLDIDCIYPLSDTHQQSDLSMVPRSSKNITHLRRQLLRHKQSIDDRYLQRLLEKIFPDDISLGNYLKLPSGKLWHHQYLYGNLEHMVCLMDLCDALYLHYPKLNRNLLKTAILLKNMGIAETLRFHKFIDYTTKGRLWGATFIGNRKIWEHMNGIPDFPEDLRLHLCHLLLSQPSGPYRHSEIPPMTREALVLDHLIKLDTQANAVERIIRNDGDEKSEWTKFNPLLNRYIYTAAIPETGKKPAD
jgi:3'-5' exoribonuclease